MYSIVNFSIFLAKFLMKYGIIFWVFTIAGGFTTRQYGNFYKTILIIFIANLSFP